MSDNLYVRKPSQLWGLAPVPENLPPSLRALPHHWTYWNATPIPDAPHKATKRPQSLTLRRNGSVNDEDTWGTFGQAWQGYLEDPSSCGVGLRMLPGIIGIDFDGCVSADGKLSAWAAEKVKASLGTYWEYSPSGRGLRAIFYGTLPASWGDMIKDGVEVYGGHGGRYLNMTGHHLQGTATEVAQADWEWLEALYVEKRGYTEQHDQVLAGSEHLQLADVPLPSLKPTDVARQLVKQCHIRPPDMMLLEHAVAAREKSRGDRSNALFSLILALLRKNVVPLDIMSILVSYPGPIAIALDHRQQKETKALEYLWNDVKKALTTFRGLNQTSFRDTLGQAQAVDLRETPELLATGTTGATVPAAPSVSNVVPFQRTQPLGPPSAATIPAPPPCPYPLNSVDGDAYVDLWGRADGFTEDTYRDDREAVELWWSDIGWWGLRPEDTGIGPKAEDDLLVHLAARTGIGKAISLKEIRMRRSVQQGYIDSMRGDGPPGAGGGGLPPLEFPDRSPQGLPRCTLTNLQVVLEALGVLLRFNQLSRRVELTGLPGITDESTLDSILVHLRDHCTRQHMTDLDARLRPTVLEIAYQQAYHPFVEGLARRNWCWDGVPRMLAVARCIPVEPLNGEDQAAAERWRDTLWGLWCTSVVAAACGYEVKGIGSIPPRLILTFSGPENTGKTTLLRRLLPDRRWFVEGATLDPHRVDSVREATSGLITELGELDATLKKDQPAIKAFFSKDVDTYRLPYATDFKSYRRQTVFAATVNTSDFLRDVGANVRYGILKTGLIDLDRVGEILGGWDSEVVWQFWLEVAQYYLGGTRWWLSPDEVQALKERNLEFRAHSAYDDLFTHISDIWDWQNGLWQTWATGGQDIEQARELVTQGDLTAVTMSEIYRAVEEVTQNRMTNYEQGLVKRFIHELSRQGGRSQKPLRIGGRSARFFFLPRRLIYPNGLIPQDQEG